MHDKLNPILFDKDDQLKSSIRDKIQRVVKEFILTLTEDEVEFPVLDVLLVGSNAGYNYNESSDLDVHIVTSFEMLCDKPHIVSALFNAERNIFNNKYDIKFKNINVEIYVEDIKANTISNGIYSVVQDKWIKYPDKSIDYDNYDVGKVNKEYIKIVKEYSDVIASDDVDTVNNFINKLYMMRKESLASEGELGTGNLVFKKLRNANILYDLKSKLDKLKSNDMSL